MSWFEEFSKALSSDSASTAIVPAGSASVDEALAHYRFQHRIKLREAVEDTFQKTTEHFGSAWGGVWEMFWKTSFDCPRSLDHFPKVFLDFLLKQDFPVELKELARFEHLLDIYPWSHERLEHVPLTGLSGESKLQMAPLDVYQFQVPVLEIYQMKQATPQSQNVLVWLRVDGVHYRVMKSWELEVMGHLHEGVALALEYAPEEESEVHEFFRWLGESSLVRVIEP